MRKIAIAAAAALFAVGAVVPALARQDDPPKHSKSTQKEKDNNPLPPYSGPKKRLAVVDIEVKATPTGDAAAGAQSNAAASVSSDIGTGLAEMLASSLQDSNRFILLERKAMADIQAEQQLSATAAFDPAAAAATGKMLGAQFLVRGAVTEFGNSHNSQSGSGLLNNLGVNRDHSEAYLALDLRIYDVQTGVLLDSVKGEGRVRSNATGFAFTKGLLNLGSSSTQNSPLAEAARRAITDAVKKVCLRLDKVPWEGHVADIDGTPDAVKYLYISQGSSAGLKPGQHFTVYHAGRTIVDPETRVVIGRTKDTLIGHGVLESCTEKLSTVAVTDGTGFQAGDVVRWDDGMAALPPTGATASSTDTKSN